MRKFLNIFSWISIFCFVIFSFWTWFYYMAITSDIPIHYTVEEWNAHLNNLKIVMFLGCVVIIAFYKKNKS